MAIPIKRSRTPSPAPYLLTPPPTGVSNKRVRFSYVKDSKTSSTSLTNFNQGESPNVISEEILKDSDDDLSEMSESESTTASNNTTPTVTSSDTTATSFASKSSVREKLDQFATLDLAFDTPVAVTKPFPFMKLPISVRNRIYEHLLVVPAIICVRQNHTSYHDEKKAFLYAERRELLPGIVYALAQITVDGFKVQFSRFSTTNINILRVNSEINAEAKAILYGKNDFEIIKPTSKLAPPPDYSVRLFPSGCQRLVTKLNIRLHSFYDLQWLLSGGCNVINNYYRGLVSLTLIVEKQSTNKGSGKKWARKEAEKWAAYIKRLHTDISHDLFGARKSGRAKVVSTWINLRVLFTGEGYVEASHGISADLTCEQMAEQTRRDEVKHALVETWELFKKGGK